MYVLLLIVTRYFKEIAMNIIPKIFRRLNTCSYTHVSTFSESSNSFLLKKIARLEESENKTYFLHTIGVFVGAFMGSFVYSSMSNYCAYYPGPNGTNPNIILILNTPDTEFDI